MSRSLMRHMYWMRASGVPDVVLSRISQAFIRCPTLYS
jgi:hypothetical protein